MDDDYQFPSKIVVIGKSGRRIRFTELGMAGPDDPIYNEGWSFSTHVGPSRPVPPPKKQPMKAKPRRSGKKEEQGMSNVLPEILESLKRVLDAEPIQSVHYLGWARAEMLQYLCTRGNVKVSVMDMQDVWGVGGAFLDDPDGPPPEPTPAWLQGVYFFVEGFPSSDLCICDWFDPDNPEALQRILRKETVQREPPPRAVFLWGEGLENTRHPAYHWTEGPGFALGVALDCQFLPKQR